MNRAADAAAASTIWPPVEKLATPWYSKIFRTPSLAIAMGSLVLVFSGVLGYLFLQRQGQDAANQAILSQSTEPDPGHGPYYTGESSANTNSAAAAMSANTGATTSVGPVANSTASNTAPSVSSGDLAAAKAPAAAEEKLAAAEDRKGYILDGVTTPTAPVKPDAQPAPPAAGARAPADQPKTERDEVLAGAGDDQAKGKDLARNEKSRSRMDREAVSPALKKEGPSRAGPLQNQSNQQAINMAEMSVTRKVGGKTFFNRNGAWIDTAYSGQAVNLVRRGSDEFKKLDSGLRSIASDLYGTVIVVWKGKAYRIV